MSFGVLRVLRTHRTWEGVKMSPLNVEIWRACKMEKLNFGRVFGNIECPNGMDYDIKVVLT